MKNKFVQTIKAPQLHKRIKHGYIILDIEPSSDNQSIFWLHMTEFNADGTIVARILSISTRHNTTPTSKITCWKNLTDHLAS